MAALWTEICLAMPAIQALGEGYEVYIVTDASGGVSVEAHEMAIQRMVQAGAVPITWMVLAAELQRDWARTATAPAVAQHAGRACRRRRHQLYVGAAAARHATGALRSGFQASRCLDPRCWGTRGWCGNGSAAVCLVGKGSGFSDGDDDDGSRATRGSAGLTRMRITAGPHESVCTHRVGLLLWSPAHAEERHTDKQNVTLWYEAFNTKDPTLLDRILSEHWVDIPAAPGQPPGRDGAKPCSPSSPRRFLISR